MPTLQIGTTKTFKIPENFKVKPDNRKVRTELYQSFIVQDFGVCGNTITCNAVFRANDFITVTGYADSGVKVPVVDHKGKIYPNCTVMVDDWNYVDEKNRYQSVSDFVSASLTIWTE